MSPWTNFFSSQSCIPLIYLSNELWCASNRDHMPKLRPREVDVPIYPNGAYSLVFHLLGLGFWMFRVFHCFSTINRPSSLIVMEFKGMQLPHLFSEISYHRPSQFISISVCKHISVFYSNEMKYYFYCISICMVIFVIFVFMFKFESMVLEQSAFSLFFFAVPCEVGI